MMNRNKHDNSLPYLCSSCRNGFTRLGPVGFVKGIIPRESRNDSPAHPPKFTEAVQEFLKVKAPKKGKKKRAQKATKKAS